MGTTAAVGVLVVGAGLWRRSGQPCLPAAVGWEDRRIVGVTAGDVLGADAIATITLCLDDTCADVTPDSLATMREAQRTALSDEDLQMIHDGLFIDGQGYNGLAKVHVDRLFVASVGANDGTSPTNVRMRITGTDGSVAFDGSTTAPPELVDHRIVNGECDQGNVIAQLRPDKATGTLVTEEPSVGAYAIFVVNQA